MEPAALVLPTQFPPCQPVPVTIPTFSLADSFANAAVALVYASSQEIMARFDTFSLDGRAKLLSKSCLKSVSSSIPEDLDRAAVASTGRKKLRILNNEQNVPCSKT